MWTIFIQSVHMARLVRTHTPLSPVCTHTTTTGVYKRLYNRCVHTPLQPVCTHNYFSDNAAQSLWVIHSTPHRVGHTSLCRMYFSAYRLNIQVCSEDECKPLQVSHSPEMSIEDSRCVGVAIKVSELCVCVSAGGALCVTHVHCDHHCIQFPCR